MKSPFFTVLVAPILASAALAVPITGSNGKVIDFAGIKEATKEGLVLKVKATGREMTVPWDKFDIAKLETEQPEIHAAYRKATEEGAATALKLGTYEKKAPIGGGPSGKWVKPDIAENSGKIKEGEGDEERGLMPYVFENRGGELPFRAFVPKRIKDTEKLPVVLYLHGAGQKGTDNSKQISGHSLVFVSDENQKKYPCIFLAPQCPPDNGWGTNGKEAPGSLAAALVEELVDTIPQVDENRLYVTGYSMGGFGTCSLIKAFPKLFAAGVPMAGGSGGFSRKNIVPIWLFYNTDDNVVKMVPIAEKLIESCKDAGLEAKVTVYHEGGHNTPQKGYREEELLPWIFAQNKDKKKGSAKAGSEARFDL